MMSELNVPAELVLRDLDATDTRALLKASVKELIAAGTWRAATGTRRGNLRGTKRIPITVLQLARSEAPPGEPLAYVHWLIGNTREYEWDGAPGRELGEVAKSIAKTRGAPKEALQRTLADLTARGLVRADERKLLGIIKRTRHVRTDAGEALLATLHPAPDPWRRRRSSETWVDTGTGSSHSGPIVAGAAGGAIAADALTGGTFMEGALDQIDTAMDQFDAQFDASFDASFDSSFDSAFDSGFDSGGGGGDSGGGGGDGGGSSG